MEVQRKIYEALNSNFAWLPLGLNEFTKELEEKNQLNLDFEVESGDRWLRYHQNDKLACLVHFKKTLVFINDQLNFDSKWNELISVIHFNDADKFTFNIDKFLVEALNEFGCGDIVDYSNINLNDLWVITL